MIKQMHRISSRKGRKKQKQSFPFAFQTTRKIDEAQLRPSVI